MKICMWRMYCISYIVRYGWLHVSCNSNYNSCKKKYKHRNFVELLTLHKKSKWFLKSTATIHKLLLTLNGTVNVTYTAKERIILSLYASILSAINISACISITTDIFFNIVAYNLIVQEIWLFYFHPKMRVVLIMNMHLKTNAPFLVKLNMY